MNYKNTLKLVREEIDRSPESVMEIFSKIPRASKHSKKQLLKGFKVELEHTKTVGSNPETIANIVLDHLAEYPDYYDKLAAAGL
jgi:hypothetical protein